MIDWAVPFGRAGGNKYGQKGDSYGYGRANEQNLHYLELDDKYVNPVLSRTARIVTERAKGSYIYDMNGDAYLDLAVGYCRKQCRSTAIRKLSPAVQNRRAVDAHISKRRTTEVMLTSRKSLPKSLRAIGFHVPLQQRSGSGGRPVNWRATSRQTWKFTSVVLFTVGTMMAMALHDIQTHYAKNTSRYRVAFIRLLSLTFIARTSATTASCVDEVFEYIDMMFTSSFILNKWQALSLNLFRAKAATLFHSRASSLAYVNWQTTRHSLESWTKFRHGFGRTGKMFARQRDAAASDARHHGWRHSRARRQTSCPCARSLSELRPYQENAVLVANSRKRVRKPLGGTM